MLLALLVLGLTMATPDGAHLSSCAPDNQWEAARCLDRHLNWRQRSRIFDSEFDVHEDLAPELHLIQQAWFNSPAAGNLTAELTGLGYPSNEWANVTLQSYWLYSHGCYLDLNRRAQNDAEGREIDRSVKRDAASGPWGPQQLSDGSWEIVDPPTYGRMIYRPRCPYLRETR